MASGIWSGHSASPARPVDQRAPRYPSCPLIDQHVLQTAVLNQNAPRTA